MKTLTDKIHAQDASEITLNDLQSQVSTLAQGDARFNNKPAGMNGTNCFGGPYVCDVLTNGDSWKAVISACDGKYYEVSITVEAGKVTELGSDATAVTRKTMYVSAKAFRLNGEMVKAGGPGSGRHAEMKSDEAKAASGDAEAASKKADGSEDDGTLHHNAVMAHYDAADAHTAAAKEAHDMGDGKGVKFHQDAAQAHVRKADVEEMKSNSALARNGVKSFSPGRRDFIHCRQSGVKLSASKAWEVGKPVQFMYMPGGISTITAGFREGAITITVDCDEDTTATVQASYENLRKNLPKQQPFGCIEHREEEASVRASADTIFAWGEYDGDEGVLITSEPTKLGADNVNGKVHRSWSPSFATDADYSKAKDEGGVFTFPEGVRGSTSNPARITGIDFCFGTLTNKPAFKNMPAVKARNGKTAAPTKLDAVFARLGQPSAVDVVFAGLRTRSLVPAVKPKETSEQILARLSGKTSRP